MKPDGPLGAVDVQYDERLLAVLGESLARADALAGDGVSVVVEAPPVAGDFRARHAKLLSLGLVLVGTGSVGQRPHPLGGQPEPVATGITAALADQPQTFELADARVRLTVRDGTPGGR